MNNYSKKNYSNEENEYLINSWGNKTVKYMGKKLNRSTLGLRKYCKRKGMGTALENRDYLITKDVVSLLGVSSNTIYKWIKNFNFPGKVCSQCVNNKIYKYQLNLIELWLKRNQDLWDATKVNWYTNNTSNWMNEKIKADYKKRNSLYRKYTWTTEKKNLLKSYIKLGFSDE